jgi:O-antigen ligase
MRPVHLDMSIRTQSRAALLKYLGKLCLVAPVLLVAALAGAVSDGARHTGRWLSTGVAVIRMRIGK